MRYVGNIAPLTKPDGTMSDERFPQTPPPFVVIEGLDGAGTTTQTRRVQERLESFF